jgi:hypothetical protein
VWAALSSFFTLSLAISTAAGRLKTSRGHVKHACAFITFVGISFARASLGGFRSMGTFSQLLLRLLVLVMLRAVKVARAAAMKKLELWQLHQWRGL